MPTLPGNRRAKLFTNRVNMNPYKEEQDTTLVSLNVTASNMLHFSHTVASYDSKCNAVISFAFVWFSLGASCAHGVSEYRCILHLSL